MPKLKIQTVGRLISPRLQENIIQQAEQLLAEEQRKAIFEIIKRTKSGRNTKGQIFPGYSPGYKRRRARRGLQTSPPNLSFTGKMLNSIRSTVTRSGNRITGSIFVNDDAGKVRGVQKLRPFLGVSKEVLAIFDGIRQSLNLRQANK